MAASDVRSHTRIPNKLVIDVVRMDGTRLRETALAQNVSAGGARLATQKIWLPGERVLLSSNETGFPAHGRVIYCQRLENGKFAVGLELIELAGESKNVR